MKFEIILGRIFLVIVSIILSLYLLDKCSVYFLPSRSPIEERFPGQYYRHPKPYTMFGGLSNAHDLNAFGYRGKAPELLKSDNEFRIFMLGGSTVFLGEPPIAELLGELAAKNGQLDTKVYNLGVVSSVSGMELARLVFETPELSPDLIIFYNGGNDIIVPRGWDPRPGYPFNFIVYETNPLLESDVHKFPIFSLMAYNSNIARYFFPSFFINEFSQLNQTRKLVGWDSNEWREKIADTYIDNVIKANTVANAFGAKFITFFQPLLHSKKKLSAKEKTILKGAMKGQNEYVLDMQKRIRVKMENVNNQSHQLFFDLSHVFDEKSEQVFKDEIHIVQPEKKLIAQKMYNVISERLANWKNNSGTGARK